MNITIIAAISADGKIAERTSQSSMDWSSKEDMRFFVEKTKEARAMIMGRTTFETIGKPLKDRLIIVLSREPGKSIPGQVEWTSESPQTIVSNLERRGYTNVIIAGGSQIYTLFLQERLVTDLYLTIEPVLFGSTGVPFIADTGRINLRLLETTSLSPQSVVHHFEVVQ